MSNLADAEDLALLLQLSSADATANEELLERLLDQATVLFESATNRTDTPFSPGLKDRVEIQEGQPSRRLRLDYPVKTLTAAIIGADLANPDETLDVADPAVVIVRGRELVRVDGKLWRLVPHCPNPGLVKVTYDTLDDVPPDATEAVLALAGQMFQSVGLEAIKSEKLDNYAVEYVSRAGFDFVKDVPSWAVAVAHHKRLLTTF